MPILIKTVGGQEFPINIDLSLTVLDLKTQLNKDKGYDISMRLVFDGAQLKDDTRVLSECGFQDNSQLYVILGRKKKGGVAPTVPPMPPAPTVPNPSQQSVTGQSSRPDVVNTQPLPPIPQASALPTVLSLKIEEQFRGLVYVNTYAVFKQLPSLLTQIKIIRRFNKDQPDTITKIVAEGDFLRKTMETGATSEQLKIFSTPDTAVNIRTIIYLETYDIIKQLPSLIKQHAMVLKYDADYPGKLQEFIDEEGFFNKVLETGNQLEQLGLLNNMPTNPYDEPASGTAPASSGRLTKQETIQLLASDFGATFTPEDVASIIEISNTTGAPVDEVTQTYIICDKNKAVTMNALF
jgi:hypothetical protein